MTTMPAYAPVYPDEFETKDADGYSAQRHLSNEDRKIFVRRAAESAELTTPAVRHARELLHAMGAYPEAALTHRRISNLLQLLAELTTASSVFPIIIPSDRGISLEWIASPRHLTLELTESGEFTFSEVGAAGSLETFLEDPVTRLPLGFIAKRIAAFSDYVSRANPGWRSNF